MKICLPIAEISVDAFFVALPWWASGHSVQHVWCRPRVFMTLLLFFGIPPAVVVATETNQIVASSLYRALEHFRRTASI